MATRGVDPAWQPLAQSTRKALHLLGYEVPACLPGEPEACGGSFAEHAAAHLAALRAVTEYRISHLGADASPLVEEVYAGMLATLQAGDPCEQGHHLGGER